MGDSTNNKSCAKEGFTLTMIVSKSSNCIQKCNTVYTVVCCFVLLGGCSSSFLRCSTTDATPFRTAFYVIGEEYWPALSLIVSSEREEVVWLLAVPLAFTKSPPCCLPRLLDPSPKLLVCFQRAYIVSFRPMQQQHLISLDLSRYVLARVEHYFGPFHKLFSMLKLMPERFKRVNHACVEWKKSCIDDGRIQQLPQVSFLAYFCIPIFMFVLFVSFIFLFQR
jgi:hypothetical protein